MLVPIIGKRAASRSILARKKAVERSCWIFLKMLVLFRGHFVGVLSQVGSSAEQKK